MNAKKKAVSGTNKIQVKVFFNGTDHRKVRIAAAVKNESMRDFIWNIVMKETEKITKKMNLD